MNWHFVDRLGRVSPFQYYGPSEYLEHNTPADHKACEGYPPFPAEVVIRKYRPSRETMAETARAKRSGLLAECDWVATASAERGVPVPANWAEYRQALRDVTAQPNFPDNIVWPSLEV